LEAVVEMLAKSENAETTIRTTTGMMRGTERREYVVEEAVEGLVVVVEDTRRLVSRAVSLRRRGHRIDGTSRQESSWMSARRCPGQRVEVKE